MSDNADSTLESVGLDDIKPAHYSRRAVANVRKCQCRTCGLTFLSRFRTTADFVFRHLVSATKSVSEAPLQRARMSHASVRYAQELKSQSFRSISILCDASPKGKMDAPCRRLASHRKQTKTSGQAQVWLPVVAVNDFAAVLTLQRMSDLHASSVDTGTKMTAAARVADSCTERLVAKPKSEEHRPKMLLNSNQIPG